MRFNEPTPRKVHFRKNADIQTTKSHWAKLPPQFTKRMIKPRFLSPRVAYPQLEKIMFKLSAMKCKETRGSPGLVLTRITKLQKAKKSLLLAATRDIGDSSSTVATSTATTDATPSKDFSPGITSKYLRKTSKIPEYRSSAKVAKPQPRRNGKLTKTRNGHYQGQLRTVLIFLLKSITPADLEEPQRTYHLTHRSRPSMFSPEDDVLLIK